MVTERDKTLSALQSAIQMEIDGKECYLKASETSGNELGRKLLKSLADQEDIHRKKFEEIYDVIRAKRNWPRTDFQPDGGQTLRTIFATCAVTGPEIKALDREFDAVQIAIDKENQSIDFYTRQAGTATYAVEREFYQTLVGEEREHSLVLLDYYQYLKDPADYFTEKEHHSIDGG